MPKGHIEPGETARESALREAREEAGLLGRLTARPVGTYEYVKGGDRCEVSVYLLRVTRELERWIEDGVRRRKWLRVRAAIERVSEPGLREILASLAERTTA